VVHSRDGEEVGMAHAIKSPKNQPQFSQMMMGPAGQPASQPASLPASQPVGQPVSQPASQPASQKIPLSNVFF